MARPITHVSYYAVLATAVGLGFIAHELAHWGAGEALGYNMAMSLNRAGLEDSSTVSHNDALMIDAAGPLMTIVQAILGAMVVWRGAVLAYPFVFAAFMMRASATFVSLFLPNDEMRISTALSLGQWTLPLIVTLALLALTIAASRRLDIGWRTNVLSYLVASALISVIVFADQIFGLAP